MKDNMSIMAENPPAPFKLEREITLMPSEFRERLSASHRSSRKSSATQSANRKKHEPSEPPVAQCDNISHLNAFSEELDNGIDLAYENSETQYHQYEEYVGEQSDEQEDDDKDTKATAIELNDDMKFMLDNAYTNYEADNYSIKTPPSNMHIRDLIVPLDEWGGKETIREKKYAVLPSIGSPLSGRSRNTGSQKSSLSDASISRNNQLDFGRDKMEQEADFFADFRVNTSKVKATPRQDPLPPIPHGPRPTPSAQLFDSQRHPSSHVKGRSKETQNMFMK